MWHLQVGSVHPEPKKISRVEETQHANKFLAKSASGVCASSWLVVSTRTLASSFAVKDTGRSRDTARSPSRGRS
jgi:hypothetical protein